MAMTRDEQIDFMMKAEERAAAHLKRCEADAGYLSVLSECAAQFRGDTDEPHDGGAVACC